MNLELTTVPRDLFYVERALVQQQADEIVRLRAEVETWKSRWEAERQAAEANEKHYDQMLSGAFI